MYELPPPRPSNLTMTPPLAFVVCFGVGREVSAEGPGVALADAGLVTTGGVGLSPLLPQAAAVTAKSPPATMTPHLVLRRSGNRLGNVSIVGLSV